MTIVPQSRAGCRGSAVLVVLVVLAILMSFSMANHAALRTLRRELQLIERRQVQRPHMLGTTNAVLAERWQQSPPAPGSATPSP